MTSTEHVACTIATASHLALAHCVATSFLRHHPGGRVYVLLVDTDRLPAAFDDLEAVGVPIADLELPALDLMQARYSTFEFCNALKPALLLHVFRRAGHHRVLYLDSDLFIVRDLGPAYGLLDEAHVLLTPHLCRTPPPTSGFFDRDLAFAKGGVLNGGFVAVRRTERAERLLEWWAARNSIGSYHLLDQAMNCDQRWLDLLPGFDGGVRLVRDPGWNVAFWNLGERTLDRVDGRDLSNGEPLRFFHFSGFDPDDEVSLTSHISSYTLMNRPDLRPLAEEYRVALRDSRARCAGVAATRPAPAGLPASSRQAADSIHLVAATSSAASARSVRFEECMSRAVTALLDADHEGVCDELARSAVWADLDGEALRERWRTVLRNRTGDLVGLEASAAWQRLLRRPPLDVLLAGAGDVLGRAAAPPAIDPAARPALWRDAGPIPEGTVAKLDLRMALAASYGRHRGGLARGFAALAPLERDGGVLLDGFVEHTLLAPAAAPHSRPWVGFVHNPPQVPAWYPIDQSAERLLADPTFQASLPWCRGLFSFSNELADWWAARVGVPVDVVALPTASPTRLFTIDEFVANPRRRIVQIGSWLRKLHAIDDLPVRTLGRAIVHQHEPYIDDLFAAERAALGVARRLDVEVLPLLDDARYDDLLATNLAFLDLYAASANNAVVECLARATPIVVSPLPAVREYLGDDYPLYAATRRAGARLADDLDRVAAAHRHLASRVAPDLLSPEAFAGAIAASPVYRELDPG